MNKPLCIDLFCGLGGWTEAFIAEGYHCRGYDIEAHDYGTGGYPGELILRDVRSITGEECKDAEVIVASPPCQAYSYRAMPWKRAKALPPPDNTLFNECFRIQREASEAAGHYIPMIVENVRGAQKWVGRARWNYGSFYLWGDVPALMPIIKRGAILKPQEYERRHGTGSWFAIDMKSSRAGITDPREITGRKVPGFRFDGSGKSFQSSSVAAAQRYREGSLTIDDSRMVDGRKGLDGKSGIRNRASDPRRSHGNSDSRKAASAMIAKIPYPLAQHIARVFKPRAEVQEIA